MDTEIRLFTIDFPQEDLDDLRDRVARTRWAKGAHNPLPDTEATDIPVAVAQFREDFRRLRRFADDFRTIVSWNSYDDPGHYAARQYPELFVADLRQFFTAVLKRRGLAIGASAPQREK